MSVTLPRFSSLLVAATLLVMTAVAQQDLPPTVRNLSGMVQGGNGDRIRVTVWRNDMQRGTVDHLCEGLTDAEGRFAFREVPWLNRYAWGMNTVIVVARAGKRVGILEVRGEQAPIDRLQLSLGDAIDLTGVLRNEVDGKPVADAWVWPSIFARQQDGRAVAWVTAPLLPWHTTTDAQGRFTLKGLPPLASFHLLAGSDAFACQSIEVSDPSRPVEATLVPGGRIRGVVVLPDGNPAKCLRVRASGRGMGFGTTTTDDAGRFELTALAADIYKVWAEAEDLTVIACAGLVIEPGTVIENQKVQLVRGGFIVGRIIDRDTGEPIVPGEYTDVAMYGPARPEGGACECTPVLPNGTFRIRAPAGRNLIYLRAAGGYDEPSEEVEVAEGQETKVEWKVGRGRRR